MLRFIFQHPNILGFGVLLTLFSSFGQTFLISIFVPELLEAFDVGPGTFGILYAGATLSGALTMPYFGKLLDRVPPRRMGLIAGLAMACACLAMAAAWNLPSLFASFLFLRLSAQGLLGLIASTTMARAFDGSRGKALSVQALGYPIGEGLLPLLVVLLIQAVGWRMSWLVFAIVSFGVLLPAIQFLTRKDDGEVSWENATVSKKHSPTARYPALFRDAVFYLLLPANILMAVILTSLFLYQIPLGASKGWTAETMARGFIGFAVCRVAAAFLIGPWIDRLTAMRLLPWQFVPSAIGLILLWLGGSPWMAYLYLALVGINQGVASSLMTATWAEVYGISRLGAIKGTVITFAIIGTAIGPLATGAALQAGVTYNAVVAVAFVLVVMVIGTTILGIRTARRRNECELPQSF